MMDTRPYDPLQRGQPTVRETTLQPTSAVPLHPHAHAIQHRSGAANFVEALGCTHWRALHRGFEYPGGPTETADSAEWGPSPDTG